MGGAVRAIVLVLAITPALRAPGDATDSPFVGLDVAGATAPYRRVVTRDNVVRFGVGRFALALVFAVMSLDRLGDRAPGWH